MHTTFHNTRAALADFDASAPSRAAAWDAISSLPTREEILSALNAAEAADAAALRAVQLAFHADTSAFNSLQNCLIVDLEFCRRMAVLPDNPNERARYIAQRRDLVRDTVRFVPSGAFHGIRRMWINQPSTLQPLHDLHGVNVLAYPEYDDTFRCFHLSGECVSFHASRSCLSEGWKPESAPAKA